MFAECKEDIYDAFTSCNYIKNMTTASRCLFTTVRKANRSLFRFYQDALSEAEISIVQLAILRSLERKSPRSFPDLSDNLVMERTSLYRTIKPLIQMGALEVFESETGRTKHARLTSHGQELIDRTMPYWQKAQDSILNELGEKQWEEMSEVLLGLPNIITKIRK